MSEKVSEESEKHDDDNDNFNITESSFKLDTSNERNIFYLFTTFFILIIFSQLNVPHTFTVNEAVMHSLDHTETSFTSSQTLDEFYSALDHTLELIYRDLTFNNTVQDRAQEYRTINNYNYILSPFRLTQRRVLLKDNTSEESKKYIPKVWMGGGIVYADYKKSYEMVDYFGPDRTTINNDVASAFFYDGVIPNNPNYQKKLSYEGKGGYVFNVDVYETSYAEAKANLDEIKAKGWFDGQTASLILDFTLYNPYLQILTYTQVICSVNPSGRLSAIDIDTESIKRSYYSTPLDIFRCILEFVFLIICGVYISRKIYEIYQEYLEIQNQFVKDEKKKKIQKEEEKRAEENKNEEENSESNQGSENFQNDEEVKKLFKLGDEAAQKGTRYLFSFFNGLLLGIKGIYNFLKDPWNFIDVANILILLISIVVWIIFIATHNNQIEMSNRPFFSDPDNNDQIENAVSLLKLYQRTVSLNLILISFKVLKYLGMMVERVTVMFKVINHAQADIFYFFVLYLIIFISFTTTFHIFYGSQVERFSTYGDSFNTLFLYLGRNILQIEEMKEMSFNFTVVYFIIFITSMDFILMNMFIAIIALSYSTVNKQMKEINNEKTLEYTHFYVTIVYWYRSFRNKIKKKKKDKSEKPAEDDQPPPVEASQEPESERKDNSDEESKRKSASEFVDPDQIDVQMEESKKGGTKTGSENKVPSQSNFSVVHSENIEDVELDFSQKEKTEEEKEMEKDLLLKMRWNVSFSHEYFNEENQVDEAAQSEKEVFESKLKVERELGKKLWSLIGYVAFFGFFTYLIFSQIRVSMFNMYNDALSDNIEGPLIISSEDVYINVTELRDYNEIGEWLQEGLPITFDQATGFINDYNYILESKLRFCFQLSKSEDNAGKGPMPPEWDRSDHGVNTEDFTGVSSGYNYSYISEGFQNQGSYCRIIDINSYTAEVLEFLQDSIIGDALRFLSVELVTYEASNFFFTYSSVMIQLKDSGEITTELDIASIDVRKYSDWYDWLRFCGEIAFIIIIFTMIYYFVRRKIHTLDLYRRWEDKEIDHLTSVEKYQRWKNRPEIFRKFWSLVDFFTMFEFCFFLLVIIMMIVWMVFIIKYQKLNNDYSNNVESMYNDFYDAKQLFNDYKILVAFSSICISFNLLSYFFMIKHTLADSKLEILYFLFFYIILILGFVSMSHLTFGPYIKEYHTFGDAMVECFSIILGDFDYLALEKVSPTMAFLFFYSYNIIFIFILANMLLAIMNTAYIQSNAKKKKKDEKSNKERIKSCIRALFYCCPRKISKDLDEDSNLSNSSQDSQSNAKNLQQNKKMKNNFILNELSQINFQELGIYTKNEEDYKLWAINCAEEIKQENIQRAKLKEVWLELLKKNEEGKGRVDDGKTLAQCKEARVNYWNYLRKAIQVIDLQNGIIEDQNKSLTEKLEQKNLSYHKEVEKTEKMYKYISKIEGVVAENLKYVDMCKDIKDELDEYEILKEQADKIKQDIEKDKIEP